MKLSDIKAGDMVRVDDGFPCMSEGLKTVAANEGGDLYVTCDDGKHFLDGQEDENGDLLGISL